MDKTTQAHHYVRTNLRLNGQTRVWRLLGLSLVTVGWVVPLLASLSGMALPDVLREHRIRLSSLILCASTVLIGLLMLVQRNSLISGWHALGLCEGHGGCQSNRPLRRATERGTRTRSFPKLSCNASLVVATPYARNLPQLRLFFLVAR